MDLTSPTPTRKRLWGTCPLAFSLLLLLLLLLQVPLETEGGRYRKKHHHSPVKQIFGIGLGYKKVVSYKPVLVFQKHKYIKVKKRPHHHGGWGWGWGGGGGGGHGGWQPAYSHHNHQEHHDYEQEGWGSSRRNKGQGSSYHKGGGTRGWSGGYSRDTRDDDYIKGYGPPYYQGGHQEDNSNERENYGGYESSNNEASWNLSTPQHHEHHPVPEFAPVERPHPPNVPPKVHEGQGGPLRRRKKMNNQIHNHKILQVEPETKNNSGGYRNFAVFNIGQPMPIVPYSIMMPPPGNRGGGGLPYLKRGQSVPLVPQ